MKLAKIALALGIASVFSVNAAPTEVTVLHTSNESVVNATWDDQVERFNAQNPDIQVNFEYIGGEAFKTKLQTLLMSDSKPDIIGTWGGADYSDRARSGLLADMTDYLPTLQKELPKGAVDAYRVDGRLYGLPSVSKPTMLYYNTGLLNKAGVKTSELETWEGFIGAVEKLKAAGITPLAIGASEGWPAHFYYSYLAMRIGGPDIFKDAIENGFGDPAFLEAAVQLRRLSDMKPFQKGYMAQDTANAFAQFGNGEAAMQLQGEWGYKIQQDNSHSKKGVAADSLGLGRFPTVAGGEGQLNDIISGIDGWAFTNSASPAAAKFMEFWLNEQNLGQLASEAMMLPINGNSAKEVKEPLMLRMAALVPESTYVHGFVDQILGAHLGGAVNDVSTELVGGTISPEDAIAMLQEAYDFQ
ncbi:extracellular solute-binding protein [Alginatibacterium sediminis]|uniref:Extracellular solute-binding protein n=1 Tax=Alginatibacterium sediminis TaxID=2164068 RepID=A0A420EGF6_9ALTE|nr:extracellular solute-binding protein [Alginatibacterium sediminis]RKF19792.1 extracellular solute-binding protein [Alginatibacterium sediminis]